MKGANAVKTASAARRAAQLGLWMALAIAISSLEGWLPTLPVPGAKPGLSNIATMYVLTSMGLPAALAVTAGKAVFALFRGGHRRPDEPGGRGAEHPADGPVPAAVCPARQLYRHRGGRAVAHNMGQLGMAMLLLDDSLLYYSPWLLFLAVAAGTVTGLTLNLVMPALRRSMARLDGGSLKQL